MKQIDISNATTLWETFAETAHFHETEYDADLEKSIKQFLKLNPNKQIKSSLSEQDISVEQLLYATLEATEPFSLMLNDLLQMFERASAQASNINLSIKFDFDNQQLPFSFDLNHFREEVRSINQRVIRKNIYMIQDPWSLVDFFHNRNYIAPPPILSSQVNQWLEEYNEKDIWPNFFPDIPKAGIARLDHVTQKIWTMIQSIISCFRQIYDPKKGRRVSHLEGWHQHSNDPVWQAETDRWIGALIMAMTHEIEELSHISEHNRIEKALLLSQKLQGFLDSITKSTEKITETVTNLVDILALPYWKRRYELYSAWILTQITKGLQDTEITYHVVNGILSFSFRKTLLATCEKLKPTLQIWGELRTQSSKPLLGKGRKKHIQPDYTLAINDATDPENTVAVVECKQYKKSDQMNFFTAISDYATGRPRGSVFLVNYGPVSKNVLNRGTHDLKKRSFAYGYVRPHGKSVDIFLNKLKNVVYEYYRTRAVLYPQFFYPWTKAGVPCSIELKWKASPKDLDLWLYTTHLNKRCSAVGFSCPGSLEQDSFAHLDCDCRNGFGCEKIEIQRWLDTGYDIIVRNYSGETEVNGEIDIHISCGSDQYSLTCTKPWCQPFVWHVIHLDSLGFQIIHQCVHDRWSEQP